MFSRNLLLRLTAFIPFLSTVKRSSALRAEFGRTPSAGVEQTKAKRSLLIAAVMYTLSAPLEVLAAARWTLF